MNRYSMKKLLALVMCIVLVAAVALTGCGEENTGDTAITIEDGKTYGEGATEFTFVAVGPDGVEVTATVRTDNTIVGEALVELGLIAGHEGPYGLYVDTVNGVTLTWSTDKMYWSFYIDGEYAMTGVDKTEIVPGSTYTIRAEKGE